MREAFQETSSPQKARSIERARIFSLRYPEAWQMMLRALGSEEASRLAQFTRNEIMTELRVRHRWSLQAIGEVFNLSRERVRQITPPIDGKGSTPAFGDNGSPPNQRELKEKLKGVFRQATRDPAAWNERGHLSRSWIVEQLGYKSDLSDLELLSPGGSKIEFILRHGLGLKTKHEMRSWAEKMYFERHMTYEEIARWLSRSLVPVATMTVHRTLTEFLDIDGYGTGRRPDRNI